jgi:enoyl-CoA hydratase
MKLQYSQEETTGFITLHNPPFNRLVDPCFENTEQLAAFFANPKLKAVVISGEGRHFSAGADVTALQTQVEDSPDLLADQLNRGKELLDIIAFSQVPVIASIKGSCMGAGLEIALACHFRIATTSAMLGFPESEIGLLPGLGGSGRLSDILGRHNAVNLLLTGKLVRGDEAQKMGLVDRAVKNSKLDQTCREFVDTLVGQRPPHLVHAVMNSICNHSRLSRSEALRQETLAFVELAGNRR